jgi:FANCL C-terminal domain/FANCL UBC-like domain 3
MAGCVSVMESSAEYPQCRKEIPWGVLVIGGRPVDPSLSDTLITPQVPSLSILVSDMSGLTHSVPLFASDGQQHRRHLRTMPRKAQKLFQRVQSTPGLQQHLESLVEAETQKRLREQLNDYPLLIFQQQAEQVFQELLAAMNSKDPLPTMEQPTYTGHDSDYRTALDNALKELGRRYPKTPPYGISDIDDNLDRVTLGYTDAAGRVHKLQLQISPGKQKSSVQINQCQASLPLNVWQDFPNFGKDPPTKRRKVKECRNLPAFERLLESYSLVPSSSEPMTKENHPKEPADVFVSIYDEFCRRIDQIQEFLNEMHDIDQNCHVLEPLTNLATATHRQLRINENVNLTVFLDVWNARKALDGYQFINITQIGGSDDAAGELLSRFESNLRRGSWDKKASIRDNLGCCLELSIPLVDGGAVDSVKVAHTQTEEHDFEGKDACQICYTKSLPAMHGTGMAEEPCITCENQPCGRIYHKSCLQDWLGSLSSARVTFDVIVGACPYCQAPIACPASV